MNHALDTCGMIHQWADNYIPMTPLPRVGIDLRPLNNVELIQPELTFLRKRWALKAKGLTPSRGRLIDGCMRTYWPRCQMVLELDGADLSTRSFGEKEDVRRNVIGRLKFLINAWCKENDKPLPFKL